MRKQLILPVPKPYSHCAGTVLQELPSLELPQVRKCCTFMMKFLATHDKFLASKMRLRYVEENMAFCQLHASSWRVIGKREHGIHHRLALLEVLLAHIEVWSIALQGIELCDIQAKVRARQSLAFKPPFQKCKPCWKSCNLVIQHGHMITR